MAKMALKDLNPHQFNNLPVEKQREMAVQAGIKSGEVRRRNKSMKQAMELMLSANLPVEIVPDQLKELGFDDGDMNMQLAIVYAQVMKAFAGNTRSAEFCRDTVGEFIGADIAEEQEQRFVNIPAKDITSSFVNVYHDIKDGEHQEYWLEGGRGSIKSSIASLIFIECIENNPNMCGIALRRVGNTLNDSVFSQLQWAIDKLDEDYPGLASDYKITKSPLSITKKSTGQKIYFRGADDPVKIKSIKPPKGMYIGMIWYEEFDQFEGMASVRKIDQSVMRGGDKFLILRSYNTPPSSQHFVNKEKKIPKETRMVHKSDYRSVPVKWLGKPFFDEAEYLKKINPTAFENEYLGVETGSGSIVFNNVELRTITDEEIAEMDRIYMGLDFGWFPDPLAWTKCYYNASNRELYILDEYVVNKQSNAEVWQHLVDEKGVTCEDMIIADSAEPKSIGDFRSYGSAMRGAEKGPDSVKYSMKWLASLAKIIIDPARTPHSMDEFSNYEYEKDKDDNVISGYPDANNHCIDSVRYALNNIWKKRGQ